MVDQQETLKILLCSDWHENFANLDKLIAREQPASFDFVFLSGDQGTANNVVGQQIDAAANA